VFLGIEEQAVFAEKRLGKTKKGEAYERAKINQRSNYKEFLQNLESPTRED
jgi:hypothetical protein